MFENGSFLRRRKRFKLPRQLKDITATVMKDLKHFENSQRQALIQEQAKQRLNNLASAPTHLNSSVSGTGSAVSFNTPTNSSTSSPSHFGSLQGNNTSTANSISQDNSVPMLVTRGSAYSHSSNSNNNNNSPTNSSSTTSNIINTLLLNHNNQNASKLKSEPETSTDRTSPLRNQAFSIDRLLGKVEKKRTLDKSNPTCLPSISSSSFATNPCSTLTPPASSSPVDASPMSMSGSGQPIHSGSLANASLTSFGALNIPISADVSLASSSRKSIGLVGYGSSSATEQLMAAAQQQINIQAQFNHLNQLNQLNQLSRLSQMNQFNLTSPLEQLRQLNHLAQLTKSPQSNAVSANVNETLSPSNAAAAAVAAVAASLSQQFNVNIGLGLNDEMHKEGKTGDSESLTASMSSSLTHGSPFANFYQQFFGAAAANNYMNAAAAAAASAAAAATASVVTSGAFPSNVNAASPSGLANLPGSSFTSGQFSNDAQSSVLASLTQQSAQSPALPDSSVRLLSGFGLTNLTPPPNSQSPSPVHSGEPDDAVEMRSAMNSPCSDAGSRCSSNRSRFSSLLDVEQEDDDPADEDDDEPDASDRVAI